MHHNTFFFNAGTARMGGFFVPLRARGYGFRKKQMQTLSVKFSKACSKKIPAGMDQC
jgi:hypothetical protein